MRPRLCCVCECVVYIAHRSAFCMLLHSVWCNTHRTHVLCTPQCTTAQPPRHHHPPPPPKHRQRASMHWLCVWLPRMTLVGGDFGCCRFKSGSPNYYYQMISLWHARPFVYARINMYILEYALPVLSDCWQCSRVLGRVVCYQRCSRTMCPRTIIMQKYSWQRNQ